jgi:hypothetical protein
MRTYTPQATCGSSTLGIGSDGDLSAASPRQKYWHEPIPEHRIPLLQRSHRALNIGRQLLTILLDHVNARQFAGLQRREILDGAPHPFFLDTFQLIADHLLREPERFPNVCLILPLPSGARFPADRAQSVM